MMRMLGRSEGAIVGVTHLNVVNMGGHPCDDVDGNLPRSCAGWCTHAMPAYEGELGVYGGDEGGRLSVGDRIGESLQVIQWLGEGGAADLYLAIEEAKRRHVAVKVLRADLPDGIAARQRMAMEGRALERISHCNVVSLLGRGVFQNQPYLVLEHVPGISLATTLRAMRGYPLPATRVQSVVAGLLDAVEAVHHSGVLHGDISPANILLGADDRVCLVDFGLARPLSATCRSWTSLVQGTPAYLAPELITSSEDGPRAASDVYSVACVVFELLTGRPPFVGESVHSVLRQHIERPAPLPTYLCPELPPAIDRALIRALKKHPGTRTGSIGQLRKDLARGLAEITSASTSRSDA